MQHALEHADAVINVMVKNKFKLDTLTNSYPITNAFMTWLKLVREYARAEKIHGDIAADMLEHFNKRMRVGETLASGSIFDLLNVKKAEMKDHVPLEQSEGLLRKKSR